MQRSHPIKYVHAVAVVALTATLGSAVSHVALAKTVAGHGPQATACKQQAQGAFDNCALTASVITGGGVKNPAYASAVRSCSHTLNAPWRAAKRYRISSALRPQTTFRNPVREPATRNLLARKWRRSLLAHPFRREASKDRLVTGDLMTTLLVCSRTVCCLG